METHQVVECQRGRHEGSAQQNDAEIALCVGLDGGGRTQKNAERCQEKLSKNGDEKSRQKAQYEARSRHLLRLLHLLGSQLSGDIVSGTMTIEETNSLDYSHHSEGNAYCRHALGIDAAHEVGVGEVVHTRR